MRVQTQVREGFTSGPAGEGLTSCLQRERGGWGEGQASDRETGEWGERIATGLELQLSQERGVSKIQEKSETEPSERREKAWNERRRAANGQQG